MPSWANVFQELNECDRKNNLDYVRVRYLEEYHKYTGRNTVCYYSGFLQHQEGVLHLEDNDMNGFMNAAHGLDKTKGIDLFLHTPGGNVTATEAIGEYLKQLFNNDIRIVIPQLSLSAGTMLSCIGKEIYMGKHSSVGPIDPQFNGIPVLGVLQEFERAIKEVTDDPRKLPIWQTIIGKYHPTFLGECKKALELSGEITSKWLSESGYSDKEKEKILKTLNSNSDSYIHGRHFGANYAKELGLKVKFLEEEGKDKMQDLALTIHHCYMHTFSSTNCKKIIENHKGNRIITR